LAAAWYALCGYDVAWPLEPSRYDLVVEELIDVVGIVCGALPVSGREEDLPVTVASRRRGLDLHTPHDASAPNDEIVSARLGLNVRHLTQRAELGPPHHPDATRLSRAGSLLAAAWYALCGYDAERSRDLAPFTGCSNSGT
jgi:hypothetical protein